MSAMDATVLPKAQPEDAKKNHILSQKKKLSFEALHISNILENCIKQIEIAAALPAMLHLNSACCVVEPEELKVALQKHQLLDERLEMLEGQESQGEEGEIRKRLKAQLEKDIKDSIRDLLRFFREHPNAINSFRERGMEVGQSEYKLISGLKMFHSHMVEELLTASEEQSQESMPIQASPSLASYTEHMARQEEGMAAAINDVDARVRHRNRC